MALYIPHSIFRLARLLYVRPETFGPYYVPHYPKPFCGQDALHRPQIQADCNLQLRRWNLPLKKRRYCPSPLIALLRVWREEMMFW